MDTWLLLDATYLCHRALHSIPDLSWSKQRTEIIYAFLRDTSYFMHHFQSTRIAFCFDVGQSKRKAIYPDYKGNRRMQGLVEQKKKHHHFGEQVQLLREDVLPDLGFSNVFGIDGYEADDLLAQCDRFIGTNMTANDDIIITSDKDVYQLIDQFTSVYNPHKQELMSLYRFMEVYRMKPVEWIAVKCIGGCLSDNIRGVPGVAEKGAISYVNRSLDPNSTKSKVIDAAFGAIMDRNKPLVKLPFPGTPTVRLLDDRLSEKKWTKLCAKYGMESLRTKFPPMRVRSK